MYLKDLIDALAAADQEHVAPLGFGEPNSFRGDYEDVAFEPASNVTVGAMLAHAKSALGSTFYGYKGGKYTMGEYTECWIAEYGSSYKAYKIDATSRAYLTGKAG